jgi:hypothetical protein
MTDPALNVRDRLARIAFVPGSVEVLGGVAKLDNEIAGKVLGFDLAALSEPD